MTRSTKHACTRTEALTFTRTASQHSDRISTHPRYVSFKSVVIHLQNRETCMGLQCVKECHPRRGLCCDGVVRGDADHGTLELFDEDDAAIYQRDADFHQCASSTEPQHGKMMHEHFSDSDLQSLEVRSLAGGACSGTTTGARHINGNARTCRSSVLNTVVLSSTCGH